MYNIKLVVAYDGTRYLGWQKTHEGPSIEEELQKAIEQILQHPIHLQAASRTDAGVHANQQIVNFLTAKEWHDPSRLAISINALLPKDISVLSIEKMPPSFHPTINSKAKEYHYFLCYGKVQMPINRFFSWHIPGALDVEEMKRASMIFLGEHDFSSFCNFRKQLHYHDHVREIYSIEIDKIDENRLRISIVGNQFLYKMVRNIVGTLVYVGKGKIKIEDLPSIISSQDRTQAGVTAPAHGLFLHRVIY